jgi:hypothetical protein
MKKRLAKWFLLVAKRLDPETHIENAQVIEDYDAQKVGLTYVITKKDIKDYRFKEGARMSLREGKRCLINEVRKKIRAHIIGCVDAKRLIEYDIKEEDGGFRVSGELKVYVPKREA